MDKILNDLFCLKDEKNAEFLAKLLPDINKDTIMGIKTPVLRDYAKSVYKTAKAERFLNSLPHDFFDENMLHGLLITLTKDYKDAIEKTERFLPFIDNWAVCDSLKPKCFFKNKDDLLKRVFVWIKSDKPFTVRFAIEMLMTHFLDGDFKAEYLQLVKSVSSDEYYVNMMISWFFATALAKQWESAFKVIEEKSLSEFCQNKTIRKAIESFRISEERKTLLKKYTIKKV